MFYYVFTKYLIAFLKHVSNEDNFVLDSERQFQLLVQFKGRQNMDLDDQLDDQRRSKFT